MQFVSSWSWGTVALILLGAALALGQSTPPISPSSQNGAPGNPPSAPGNSAQRPSNQSQPHLTVEPTPDQEAGAFVFKKQVDEVVLHATVVASADYHPIKVVASAPGYGQLIVRTRNGIYTGESVR